MKNKPAHSIQSVDHALLLAQLLVLEGPLRVTEAATRLGVSASTAHRLLAMLVYRDFAEQDADKRYHAGAVLRGHQEPDLPIAQLRRAGLGPLQRLVDRVEESSNLVVLTGAEVRFVHTVECHQLLRVGDRAGKALPAHVSSAGKAILSSLPAAELNAVLKEYDEAERARVKKQLRPVRLNGFAINNQQTEPGLTAIGVSLTRPSDIPAGVSIAMPTARFDKQKVDTWVRELRQCASSIEDNLAGLPE